MSKRYYSLNKQYECLSKRYYSVSRQYECLSRCYKCMSKRYKCVSKQLEHGLLIKQAITSTYQRTTNHKLQTTNSSCAQQTPNHKPQTVLVHNKPQIAQSSCCRTISHEARYTQANKGGSKLPSCLPHNILCASVPPWLSIVATVQVCDATGAQ